MVKSVLRALRINLSGALAFTRHLLIFVRELRLADCFDSCYLSRDETLDCGDPFIYFGDASRGFIRAARCVLIANRLDLGNGCSVVNFLLDLELERCIPNRFCPFHLDFSQDALQFNLVGESIRAAG